MASTSLKDIPKEDLVAVIGYITEDFKIIDSALRRVDRAKLEQLDAYIQVATMGLFQLPCYRGAVFRGATLTEEAAAHYAPGSVVYEHAFISASADPRRTFPGNTTFVIGSLNGRQVAFLSDNPEEQEVVFFTGTHFKVLAVEMDVPTKHRTIFLLEIPDLRLVQSVGASS